MNDCAVPCETTVIVVLDAQVSHKDVTFSIICDINKQKRKVKPLSNTIKNLSLCSKLRKKMTKLLILTLLLVGVVVLLMGFRVFFTKKGEFPSSHVEDQPALREKGLKCHRYQTVEEQERRNLFDRIEE